MKNQTSLLPVRLCVRSRSFVIQIITYRLILTGNYKVLPEAKASARSSSSSTVDQNERIKHEHDVVINMTYYIRPCVSSIHVPLSWSWSFYNYYTMTHPRHAWSYVGREGTDGERGASVYIFLFIIIVIVLVNRRRLLDMYATRCRPEELVASLSLHFNCSSG